MKILSLLVLMTLHSDGFDEAQLFGRWRWVETYGGFAESRVTSAGSRVDRSILFTKDHAVFYFSKDSVSFKSSYLCQSGKSIFSEDQEVILEIKGLAKKQIINLNSDTLMLRENAFDGFTHVFVKLK